jgi:hypothetical protein
MIARTEANVQRAARAIAGVLYGTEDRWLSVADAALAAIIALDPATSTHTIFRRSITSHSDGAPPEVEPPEKLRVVAAEALAAYRAIFPTSCWNERDKAAFRTLQEALTARPGAQS